MNFFKKRWIKILLSVILTFILIVGGILSYVYFKAASTFDEMSQKVNSIDEKKSIDKLKNGLPINILLLGVDQRGEDSGRSDTLIIMSLHPKTNQLFQISIPRDTRAEIVGHGTTDKINHAYAFGGVDMSIATVKKLFDIDIDYFVRINMEGLSEFVDAVGGITVMNSIDWTDKTINYHFSKGKLTLNGEQALVYSRMRKLDPNGDFGRNERQREVIDALLQKVKSSMGVSQIPNLLGALGNNVKTNLDLSSMRKLFTRFRDVAGNSTDYELQGKGTRINNIYYLQITEEEKQKVHDMIVQ